MSTDDGPQDSEAMIRALGEIIGRERRATIEALTGTIAHEVVDPASYALLRVTSAERALASGNAQRAVSDLKAIREGLERIVEVVRDGRVSAPKPTSAAPVSLAAIVRNTLPLASERFASGAMVTVEETDAPAVSADPVALGQVLLHLLHNAADAVSDEGHVTIRLGPHEEGACFEVHDDGPGFLPEVLARVGEPFLSTRDHGCGLGLHLSSRIVRELGGRLEVRNVPEGGACVTVLLPGATGGSE